MAAASSSAGAAANGPPGLRPLPPPWVRLAQLRVTERREREFVSDAQGRMRWEVADERMTAGRTQGEPFAPGDDTGLQNLERDLWLMKRNLTVSAASFEPQRHSLVLCGRPVQAVHDSWCMPYYLCFDFIKIVYSSIQCFISMVEPFACQ